MPGSASEFDNLNKNLTKYYLEEYHGTDVQIKVVYLEF
jgi:hypothetical protein